MKTQLAISQAVSSQGQVNPDLPEIAGQILRDEVKARLWDHHARLVRAWQAQESAPAADPAGQNSAAMDKHQRDGLVARLLQARDDPIDVQEDPEYGEVRHDVIGVLPEDLDAVLGILAEVHDPVVVVSALPFSPLSRKGLLESQEALRRRAQDCAWQLDQATAAERQEAFGFLVQAMELADALDARHG